MLLVLGVPERTVMDVMAWSSTAMAVRYQHVTDPIRREVATRIGGLLWAPPKTPLISRSETKALHAAPARIDRGGVWLGSKVFTAESGSEVIKGRATPGHAARVLAPLPPAPRFLLGAASWSREPRLVDLDNDIVPIN